MQTVAVFIESCAVTYLDQTPNGMRLPLCQLVEESRQLFPPSSAWIGIGGSMTSSATHGYAKVTRKRMYPQNNFERQWCAPAYTLWGGQRAIDYCLVSTSDVYHNPSHDEAIADHRIVCSDLSLQCPDKQPVHKWLKQCFKGRRKGFDKEKRDDFLKWQQLQKPGCPQVATQTELDAAWQHLETCYEVGLNFECRRAADDMNDSK